MNRAQGQDSFRRDHRQTFNADLLSLNFNERGFRNMSLVGRETLIYRNGILSAAKTEGQKGGTSIGEAALMGLGVLAAAGGIALALREPETPQPTKLVCKRTGIIFDTPLFSFPQIFCETVPAS